MPDVFRWERKTPQPAQCFAARLCGQFFQIVTKLAGRQFPGTFWLSDAKNAAVAGGTFTLGEHSFATQREKQGNKSNWNDSFRDDHPWYLFLHPCRDSIIRIYQLDDKFLFNYLVTGD
jgi:hypothetical protein